MKMQLHPKSYQSVMGSLMKVGELIESTDLYDSSSGEWSVVPETLVGKFVSGTGTDGWAAPIYIRPWPGLSPKQVDHPEYWTLRGIGSDWVPCMVTGKPEALRPNLSGFVTSKEAGERIVTMFGGRARLDYRDYEPNWIQVKVGVNKEYEEVLRRLERAVSESYNILSPEMIFWALDPVNYIGYTPATIAAANRRKLIEDDSRKLIEADRDTNLYGN